MVVTASWPISYSYCSFFLGVPMVHVFLSRQVLPKPLEPILYFIYDQIHIITIILHIFNKFTVAI